MFSSLLMHLCKQERYPGKNKGQNENLYLSAYQSRSKHFNTSNMCANSCSPGQYTQFQA